MVHRHLDRPGEPYCCWGQCCYKQIGSRCTSSDVFNMYRVTGDSRDTSKLQRPRGAKVRKVFDAMFQPYVARAVKAGKMWRDVKTLPEVRG